MSPASFTLTNHNSVLVRAAACVGIPAEVWDLTTTEICSLGSLHWPPYLKSLLAWSNMVVDKIKPEPHDDRVKRVTTEVNGQRWSYLDAAPKGQQKGTVFLIHGFPDISLAWRYQIPMLTELGMRCIALDCKGYGDTGTSDNLHDFGFKNHADAIEGICKQIGASNIVIGGHDWGGAVVWRVCQWKPDLVSHVFSVCTPYFKVFDQYVSTEQLVKGGVPQFGYQLQFGSEDKKVEKVVNDEASLKKFLKGLYGGKPKSGKTFMDPKVGVDLDLVENDEIGMTPLLSEEELDYYVKQFSKNGINGPLNWYRTRKVNYEDDRGLPEDQKQGIQQPTLFIQALNDFVLTPDLAKIMKTTVPKMTHREVPAGHWALWQTPEQTNNHIKEWFEGVVLGGKDKL